jgi:hypothetical protein
MASVQTTRNAHLAAKDRGDLSREFDELERKFMAIAQTILDAQAKLDASVAALTARIAALKIMTPAETQSVADVITKAASTLDTLDPAAVV